MDVLSRRRKEFQSAPPTEVRGDMRATRHKIGCIYVSIRSPHRSEGRCGKRHRVTWGSKKFQSAPPTEVRGD